MQLPISLLEIEDVLKDVAHGESDQEYLEAGYREMAADTAREVEAIEWIEGTLNSKEL